MVSALALLTGCGLFPLRPPASGGAPSPRAGQPADGDASEADRSRERFDVELTHSYTVGEHFRVQKTLTSTQTTEIEVNGELQRRESHSRAELAAEAEVLAVDGRGQPSRTRYTLELADVRVDDEAVTLEPGVVILVTRGDEPGVEREGGTLSEAQREALARLLPHGPPKPHTDDQVFGPDGPRELGARWGADLARLSEVFERRGMPLGDAATADVELSAVEACGDARCLDVAVRMELPLLGLPGLPEGTRVAQAHMRMEAVKRVPTPPDAEVPRRERTQMSLEATLSVRSGERTFPMRTRASEVATVEVHPL